jgi:hypothetical protein
MMDVLKLLFEQFETMRLVCHNGLSEERQIASMEFGLRMEDLDLDAVVDTAQTFFAWEEDEAGSRHMQARSSMLML